MDIQYTAVEMLSSWRLQLNNQVRIFNAHSVAQLQNPWTEYRPFYRNLFPIEYHLVISNDPAAGHGCQRNRRKGGVKIVTLGRHRRIEPELRRRCVCAHVRAGA